MADSVVLDVDRIEQLATAASAGPWTYGDVESVAGGSLYDSDVMIASLLWDSAPVNPAIRRTRTTEEADANGEFIAGLDPPTALALVAEIRRLRDALDACEKQFQAKVVEVIAQMNETDEARAELVLVETRNHNALSAVDDLEETQGALFRHFQALREEAVLLGSQIRKARAALTATTPTGEPE